VGLSFLWWAIPTVVYIYVWGHRGRRAAWRDAQTWHHKKVGIDSLILGFLQESIWPIIIIVRAAGRMLERQAPKIAKAPKSHNRLAELEAQNAKLAAELGLDERDRWYTHNAYTTAMDLLAVGHKID
jgi:hypothetical protein